MKEPANLLIIDTSTSASVLGLKTPAGLIEATTVAKNSHSREILPMINGLVSEAGLELADLDAFVFGQGPGSFTGLRIAAGVIQGLAFGLDKPVAQVSTMAALAQSLVPGSDETGEQLRVCVALTARLDEVYFGAYRFDDAVAHPVVDERVASVSALPHLEGQRWVILGDYAPELEATISASTGATFADRSTHRIPRVEDLLTLGLQRIAAGETVTGLEVTPVYLREEVASKPART